MKDVFTGADRAKNGEETVRSADIETAKYALASASVVLCKGGKRTERTERGVMPLLLLIASGKDWRGYSVADKIVRKAAALLFVKMGVREVYGEVISIGAKQVLEKYGIEFSYRNLVAQIMNRQGTGQCPMEKSTEITDDPEQAYQIILKAQEELHGGGKI